MRKVIQIGSSIYKSKKEALSHYRKILNSYEFGEILAEKDSSDVLALLKTRENSEEKIGAGIKQIRIARIAKYNTRSFEIIRKDETTEYFSYIQSINSPPNPFTLFSMACREAVQEDIRKVKLSFFEKHSKKGMVKCQETKELLRFEELNVDHRQPNTFSVIVDRFIEINKIDIEKIEYVHVPGGPNRFGDEQISFEFKNYHKEKANLRLVKKGLNLGRSHQARIVRQQKDLKIE